MGKRSAKRAAHLRVALFVYILLFEDGQIIFYSVAYLILHPVQADED